MKRQIRTDDQSTRRHYIGGSDARLIMGNEEAALIWLWREKRGKAEPEDLSENLVVQLGVATEELNRCWYEAIAGGVLSGWYIASVCYAIAVISLGWFPWNFLLIGLLFLIRNKPLRERAPLRSGPDDGHVVLNSVKTTFAVSRSCR
jgi:hypothetical protein